MSEFIVCTLTDKAYFVGRCRRCHEPMLETELGLCPDCREWLKFTPQRDGGRGKRRGPSRER